MSHTVGKGRPPLGGMAGHPYLASIGVCRACSVLGARHGRRAACGVSACAMHTPPSAFSYDPAFSSARALAVPTEVWGYWHPAPRSL